MKKLFLSIGFLIMVSYAFAQHPVVGTTDSFALQTLGSSATLVKSKGAISSDSGFINSSYVDTTAANKGKLKNYPGAQIRTGDTIWVRNKTATAWLFFLANLTSTGGTGHQLVLAPISTNPNLNGMTLTDDSVLNVEPYSRDFGGVTTSSSTPQYAQGQKGWFSNTDSIMTWYGNESLRSVLYSGGIQSWKLNNGAIETGYASITTPVGTPGVVFSNTAGTGRSQIRQYIDTGGLSFGAESSGAVISGNQFVMLNNGHTFITGYDPTVLTNVTDEGYLFNVLEDSKLHGTVTVKTIPDGTPGVDSLLVEDDGLIKKISPASALSDYVRHEDSTAGGYYPYSSNPLGYLTGISTFNALTDDIVNGIAGPVGGDSSYTPDLSGDEFLIGKDLYQVIRNNIPAIRGTDYLFNNSTGTIRFTQPANDGENFMFYYTAANSLTISDTDAIVSDTSVFATAFGIMIAGSDLNVSQKVQLSDSFDVTYIRTSVILTKWDGSDNYLDAIEAAGKKAILNVNWKSVEKDGAGNKIPNAYVQASEYAAYDALLNDVLTKYGSIIEVVVIENEPTNDNYYTGNISDYIALLAQAATVVHSHGLLIADGCIHVELVQKVMAGGSLTANAQQVSDIIDAYPSLNLDYTNIHTHGPNQATYTIDLKSVCDYIRANNGGKPVMCNEYHLDASYPSLIQSLVAKMKEANVVYSIPFDAGSQTGGGVPFHVVGSVLLNTLGEAYKTAIQ